jgi:hypothetical protein
MPGEAIPFVAFVNNRYKDISEIMTFVDIQQMFVSKQAGCLPPFYSRFALIPPTSLCLQIVRNGKTMPSLLC